MSDGRLFFFYTILFNIITQLLESPQLLESCQPLESCQLLDEYSDVNPATIPIQTLPTIPGQTLPVILA